MRFPLSFRGNNVEFLGGSIDVILIGNQSHRDSLIYFDNYVIIDDRASLDKTFVPLLQTSLSEIHGRCINQPV